MKSSQDPAEAMRAIQAAMESMQQMENARKSSKTPSVSKTSKSIPKQNPSLKTSNKAQKTPAFGQWFSRFLKTAVVGSLFILSSPILLVKGSLWLHLQENVHPYLSLGIATLACIIITSLIVGIFLAITTRKAYLRFSFKLIAFLWLLVLIPLMLVMGLAGSKDANTATEYHAAHPLMKMAVSTYALFDREVIMTDISRTRADYEKMGLAEATYSKHFVQSDGYVHAVDLRTIGRPEWQNKLAEYTFKFMGFKTLRHVGTADHLHISIP